MGISLAPDVEAPPVLKKKPEDIQKVNVPAVNAAAPTGGLQLAPAPQAPGKAGGLSPAPAMTAPSMTAPSTAPAPTVAAPSAPVDRVKLATETFNNSAAATQGAYDAAQRTTIRNRAALGQIGSGGLRTSVGDLQLARERDLDLLRKDLVNKATEGSIADATTAYQQALASSQQGLAERVANSQIGVAEGSLGLEKERLGQSGEQFDKSLGLEKEKLDVTKQGQAATIEQQKAALALQEKLGLGGLSAEQQRIAIAQKQQDLDAAFNAGKMSLAERDAARADLALAQQNALNQAQLGLETEKLGIAKGAQDIANKVALGQLSLAQASAALDEKVRMGQLTLAEKDQALRELSQSQGNANEQQRIQLAKDQLAAEGERFGLSLAQQKELATLADKTQNRQLDISSAQGKNTLILELARIMGAKDMGSIDPNFLAAIAKSLGIVVPTQKADDPAGPKGTGTTTGGLGGPVGGGTGGTGTGTGTGQRPL